MIFIFLNYKQALPDRILLQN